MQYSQTLLDDIRAAVDIVDLVSRFVNLRKAGSHWKGLCPFHTEKTPSFTVNPRKSIFHCFGCGVGGDAFGFVMRQDRLSFPEAVRALAKTAGVALPDEHGARSGDSGREELTRVMDLAGRFYADTLWKPAGERARAYLGERGIDTGIARHFGLGYAPEGWESLLTFMRAEKVSEEALIATGLAVARENRAGAYDRFRGRLLFPIRDLQGRVVAFGGRGFGDEQPKYLNSPETPLYTKGNLLYGADLARMTIQSQNRALLVEGYVDCIMAHQHGFTGTVAALGTAFTPAQLALLRRYCDEVVTFFDADAAGQKAAARAEELLEPAGRGMAWAVNRSGAFEGAGTLRVKVALLPAGHDPDTFLRSVGREGFTERIAAARSILSYALDRALVDPDGATGPRARTTAFARVALLLAKVADGDEAAALSREAAAKLGVDPTQLWIEAQRLQSSLRTPPAQSQPPAPVSMASVERDLVALLLHSDEARAALLALLGESDELGHASLRAIVEALRRRPDAPAESLMTDLPTDEARSVLSSLLVEDRESVDARVSIGQFQRRLERSQRLRRAREASQAIAETQAKTGVAAPMHAELRTLHKESAVVYEITGGVAQSLEHGTSTSPRSSDE
ncbi:MAG: DNA primase [Candidatus Rokuibacteriota bacterium]|nr:MAG: DNA primase [Candidatus Rokubacteria bacterium]